MNQLNQTISVLRVQIEAEKKSRDPNWNRISKLEQELKSCLSQMDV